MFNIIENQPRNFAQTKAMFWIANLFPLYAVWYFDWSLFLVMYIFWFEMLIVTVFEVAKIAVSQRLYDAASKVRIPPVSVRDFRIFKAGMIVRYVVARVGIFFFYMLFLVFFVGLSDFGDDKAVADLATSVTFRNQYFNVAVFGFFLAGLLDFIGNFYLNDRYRADSPTDHGSFLDARVIVVHVSLVLGVFFQMFLSKFIANHKLIILLTTVLFLVIKISAEAASRRFFPDELDTRRTISGTSE